ncbi:MAG: MmcQ/YjbR family DNA-binding protein [Hyphomonadaceae bacterium]|nr:MmcQ/YjbR family DNA-binding protein [Hyphomonadaceae bacterium]
MTTVVKLKHPLAKELRKAALGFPDTVEDFPWGHSAFKVSGKKVFLFLGEDEAGGWSASMKLPFRNDEALTIKGAERTGYGLSRSGWISFRFTAKAKAPMARLVDYLDESWRAVAPRKLSAGFAPPTVGKGRKAT